MKSTLRLTRSLLMTLVLTSSAAFASTADLRKELASLATEFNAAQYDTPAGEARAEALNVVRAQAAQLEKQYPKQAEPLVWQGWALLSRAGALHDMSSIGLMKQAREKFEAAAAIDPSVYNAAPYTFAGRIHLVGSKFPFPMTFGDKQKARDCFRKALAINSTAGPQNLAYAELLLDDKDYAGALKYGTAALNAPPRPGSERADREIHTQAEKLIATAREKLR